MLIHFLRNSRPAQLTGASLFVQRLVQCTQVEVVFCHRCYHRPQKEQAIEMIALKRTAAAIAGAVIGYLIGAFSGGYLVASLSSNTHDVSVEAAMTGAFVLGPVAALIGLCAGLWLFQQYS